MGLPAMTDIEQAPRAPLCFVDPSFYVCASLNIGIALLRLRYGGMKSAHRQESERDKRRQHHKLCNDKRGLRLRRRQRMQERQLPKSLNDRHENIEIERDHGGDDVDPAPRCGELKRVKGNNSEYEQYEG